jgi:hypothetical protein
MNVSSIKIFLNENLEKQEQILETFRNFINSMAKDGSGRGWQKWCDIVCLLIEIINVSEDECVKDIVRQILLHSIIPYSIRIESQVEVVRQLKINEKLLNFFSESRESAMIGGEYVPNKIHKYLEEFYAHLADYTKYHVLNLVNSCDGGRTLVWAIVKHECFFIIANAEVYPRYMKSYGAMVLAFWRKNKEKRPEIAEEALKAYRNM